MGLFPRQTSSAAAPGGTSVDGGTTGSDQPAASATIDTPVTTADPVEPPVSSGDPAEGVSSTPSGEESSLLPPSTEPSPPVSSDPAVSEPPASSLPSSSAVLPPSSSTPPSSSLPESSTALSSVLQIITTRASSSSPSSSPTREQSQTPISTPAPSSTAFGAANVSDSKSESSFTTSFTTIVTKVNGVETTITSALPTSLYNPTSSGSGSSKRTATIAGASAGAVILFLLLLSAVFLYRRRQLQQLFTLMGRKEKKSLLDGEDFDDDDELPMRRYRDAPPSGAAGGLPARNPSASTSTSLGHALGVQHPSSNPPPLFRVQASESGSIFREEGIWPPGKSGEFVDPFIDSVKANSEVDLSGIVANVMGPGGSARSSVAGSSAAGPSNSGSPANPDRSGDAGPSAPSAPSDGGHNRMPTSLSAYSEFGASHFHLPTSSSTYNASLVVPTQPLVDNSVNSMYNDPFRDVSHVGGRQTSVFFPELPPGAKPPTPPGLGSPPGNPPLTPNKLQKRQSGMSYTPPPPSPGGRAQKGSSGLSGGDTPSLWLTRKITQGTAAGQG